MSAVIIKLLDLDDGGIDVKVDFVPPIEDDDDFDLTGAQAAALLMIASVAEYANAPTLDD